MNKPARVDHSRIVADLDAETMAVVERVAKRRGVTNSAFAAEAIRRVAESDDDFDAFLQAGIDQLDRGEIVSQDEMEAWFEEKIAAHRSR